MTNVEILASGNESEVRMSDYDSEGMSFKEFLLMMIAFFRYDPDKKPAIE